MRTHTHQLTTIPSNMDIQLPIARRAHKSKALEFYQIFLVKHTLYCITFGLVCLHIAIQINYWLIFMTLWILNLMMIGNSIKNLLQMNRIIVHDQRVKQLQCVHLLESVVDFSYSLIIFILISLDYNHYIIAVIPSFISLLLSGSKSYFELAIIDTIKMFELFVFLENLMLFLTTLSIALKLDDIIQWTWVKIFWIVWLKITVLIAISVALVLMSISKIVYWIFDNVNANKVDGIQQYKLAITMIWITIISINISVLVTLFSTHILWYLEDGDNSTFLGITYYVGAYLIVITILTIIWKQQIITFVMSVLHEDEPIMHNVTSPIVLPNTNPVTSRQLTSRFQIPKMLYKISNTYFGIPKANQQNMQSKPTQQIQDLVINKKGHRRVLSSQAGGSQVLLDLHHSPDTNNKSPDNQLEKKSNSVIVQNVIFEQSSAQDKSVSISSQGGVCLICYDKPPDSVIMNCGHGGLCYECAVDTWNVKNECYLSNCINIVAKFDRYQRESYEGCIVNLDDLKISYQSLKMNYEWFQDDNQIKIRYDIKNTTLQNIHVQVADLVVRVNVLDKKYTKTIDLHSEVSEGSVIYGNNVLEVTLLKKEAIKWTTLTPELPKDQIIKRRQESYKRKELEDQSFSKHKQDLKLEFDNLSTKEQLKIEDIQRNKIETIKKTQKEQAEKEVYSGMDEQANYKDINQNEDEEEEIEEEQYKPQPKQTKPQQQQPIEQKPLQPTKQNTKSQDIFTDQDVKKLQQPLPKPRESTSVQLAFTDKVYPNLAAREQHFRDAPLPRSRLTKAEQEKSENPLFLKDKGDEFFKNKDFYSALNAYSAAYKHDPQMIVCLANRSACYLSLFNFEEAYNDCETVLLALQAKTEDKLYQKCLQRKRICQAWKGDLNQAQTDLPEQATLLITNRISSNQYKFQGDQYLKITQYQRAIDMYKQSLKIDENNELSLANAGLAYMKQNQFKEALEYFNKAIDIAKPFVMYVNLNPNIGKQSSRQAQMFLLKNYMRQSKCLFSLNFDDEALQSVKQALKLDDTDEEARSIMNKIQQKIEKNEALKLKEQATDKLKAKEYKDALYLYNECLKKLTPQEDLLDFLAVLLNKCLCSYFLEQYEEIIGACTRGIKIILTQNNKVLSFEPISKETKQKLIEYQVRFLVRRSNAYLKQNQTYHAIADLEAAIEIDPNNETLKKDIEKLKPK